MNDFIEQWLDDNPSEGCHWSQNFLASEPGFNFCSISSGCRVQRVKERLAVPSTPSPSSSLPRKHVEPYQMNAPTGSSISRDTSRGSSRTYGSLVEDPMYRIKNLAANNLFFRSRRELLPEAISNLLRQLGEDRSSPSPTQESIVQDAELEDLQAGTSEANVEEYWRTKIFPPSSAIKNLMRADRLPISKGCVPRIFGSIYKLSNPQPDMLYGYHHINAFSPEQRAQLLSMGDAGLANNLGLLYPFMIVEFKADGPTGAGSLWVATNQCLVGAASCVNISARLDEQLQDVTDSHVLSLQDIAFSAAVDGTEARLFVTWKEGLAYYTQTVETFCLQRPGHFLEFRRYIRNILDWGNNVRLSSIQVALNTLWRARQSSGSTVHTEQGTSSREGLTSSPIQTAKRVKR